jgi:hypothetical protein
LKHQLDHAVGFQRAVGNDLLSSEDHDPENRVGEDFHSRGEAASSLAMLLHRAAKMQLWCCSRKQDRDDEAQHGSNANANRDAGFNFSQPGEHCCHVGTLLGELQQYRF